MEFTIRNMMEQDKQEVLEKQVVSQAVQLKLRSDELLRQIASTGYDELKDKLLNLNELLEHLSKSADKWQRTAEGLKAWVDEDVHIQPDHLGY